MSIKVMSRVWEHSRAKGSGLLVLLAVADWADDRGVAYPSMAGLAKKCRLSVRATRYLVRDLEAAGELAISTGAAAFGANLYRVISPPAVPGKDCTPPAKFVAPAALGKVCRPPRQPVAAPPGKIAPLPPAKFAANTSSVVEPSIKPSKRREREALEKPDPPPPLNGDRQRILALAFPYGATTNQKQQLLNNVEAASAEGVPLPWIAAAIVSRRLSREPFYRRIDRARDGAAEVVAHLNAACRKKFSDLQHVCDSIPGTLKPDAVLNVLGVETTLGKIKETCTAWPATGKKEKVSA